MDLPEDLASELYDSIQGLMYHYNYNPQGSDYCCEFCWQYLKPNVPGIKHLPDCAGLRFIVEYNEQTGEDE